MSLSMTTAMLTMFLGGMAASLVTTWIVARILERLAILDRPNDRSSHKIAVPRGGGWGIWLAVLPLWGWLFLHGNGGGNECKWLAAGFCLLAGISWWDDCHPLSAALRFPAQAIAVTLGMQALPPESVFFFSWLPIGLDHFLAGLLWLWFINLFNFMDGIDGISGVETTSIATGIGLLVAAGALPTPLAGLAAALLAGAALGFLAHNWHPARLFLGDVGSIPMGFLLGWLLLLADAQGDWTAALLLPLYYLADATLTLLKRLARGEKIWQAHRTHFYQRASSQGGLSHERVAAEIAVLNSALIAFALGSVLLSKWFMVPGILAVAFLLRRFSAAGERALQAGAK